MKQQDIDKKIGMPDVDKEWARFEREVIGEETQPKKRSLAPWAWGIGIAASIAVVAGLFFFGNGSKVENEGSVAMAEGNKFEVPEEKDENDWNAEKAITSNIIDNKSENLLAEAEPSPEEDASVSVPVQDVAENDFSTVEEQPHFPGGDKALMDFIRKNLRYPALTQAYVTKGRVLMSMKIDTLGQVSDIKAMRFWLDYAPSLLSHTSETEQTELKADISRQLEEECARVIALMPTWQPGRIMGNRTNMRYYIPFMFQPELLAKARESEGLANAAKEDALHGRIAGMGRDSLIIHFVSKTERPSLPYIWERDTVLVLVNGKEDKDFLRYLSSMSHGSMSNVYDYFFERNQLFLMQSLPSKEVQASSYDPSLFEGRDVRLVVDYLTKPFTSVSQLTPEQIKSRRLTYLRNKYCAGFSKNSNQDYYAPDLYDSPAKERLFGLTAAKCRRYGQQHEYFGPMGSDSHGIYTPLIRDVVMTTHDDAWWENGEVWVLKDDPHFNQIVDDIRQAATRAESSAVTSGDSIVRLAFIFGGKVAEGQPNDLLSGMQKKLYEQVKKSSFAFKPDEDAPTWWWGEAYYSTTSQRQLWMHLHSVDKLYATDCPELLSNRRHIEGTVTDEKGEPLAEASVGIGFVTPWDAVTTDSQGHFDLWMPFRDATIHVNHVGYIPKQIQPADTILNFHMKDATKIKEVKVIPKKELKPET